MKEFRMRPKNEFLHTAKWEEIYFLTEHWLKELEFFKDEVTFLDILVGKYFILISNKESLQTIQKISKEINDLGEKQFALHGKATKHLKDVGLLMEKAFSNDEKWFRDEHVKLEEEITEIYKQFRDVKKEVFGIIKHIMDSQKLQHLLNA